MVAFFKLHWKYKSTFNNAIKPKNNEIQLRKFILIIYLIIRGGETSLEGRSSTCFEMINEEGTA